MAEQLTVYKNNFEKERAQQEKILKEHNTLKAERNSLQQEKDTIAANLQEVCTLV